MAWFGWTGARRIALSLACMTVTLAGAGAARATEWMRLESPHFVVYTTQSESKGRAYTLMLEDFDSVLRTMLLSGAPPQTTAEPKLTVFLVNRQSQLRIAWPSARESIDGFYYAGTEDTYAVAVRDDGNGWEDRNKGDDTVLHEYVHHFMFHNFPSAYPAWLTEGYAEYFATTNLSQKIVIGDFAAGRAYSLVNETWLPLKDVFSKRVWELTGEQPYAFYAESWLLTHYLISDPERLKSLVAYLQALKTEEDPSQLWPKFFGDPVKLDAALHSYMKGKLMGKVLPRTWKPPTVSVSPVPDSEGAILLASHAVDRDLTQPQQERTLKLLREAQVKTPDDPAVMVALARAESEFGDRQAAGRLLDAVLAKDPNDAAALRQKAINLLSPAKDAPAPTDDDRREASRMLVAANKAQPDDYRTLYWYARSRRFEAGYPSENTYKTMLRAADLAPQVSSIRYAAGQMAIYRKDADTAREMLLPVIGDPHGGEISKQAKKLLADLERASASGAP